MCQTPLADFIQSDDRIAVLSVDVVRYVTSMVSAVRYCTTMSVAAGPIAVGPIAVGLYA
jgi:hypothetical protein